MEHTLPIGTILDKKYKILKVIGSGGFGITYQAEDIFLNELYVIKEFFLSGNCVRAHNSHEVHTQNLAKDLFDKFKRRFLEEAKILHKLKKVPSIVEVTAFFEENNTGYLVMPFVEAEDLEKYLRKQPQNRISQNEALTYFEQIVQALSVVHAEKIVHRDIKPANILVSKQGKAYLIDFGAAREFIAEGISHSMTAILTPGYAPFEQYNEQAKRFATMDIYAMGALLYRMLTGEKPLNAISRWETVLPTPHSLVPAISEHVSDAIMKALEMKAENRFQSAKDMMAALQGTRIEKNMPPPHREESDWDKATKQDTIGAYQTFLLKYPQSSFKGIAQNRIKALQPPEIKTQTPEELAWEQAKNADNIAAYQVFVDKYRSSRFRPQAQQRIADLTPKPNPLLVFWEKYKIHTLVGLALLLVIFFVWKFFPETTDTSADDKRIADSMAAAQAQKRVDDSIIAVNKENTIKEKRVADSIRTADKALADAATASKDVTPINTPKPIPTTSVPPKPKLTTTTTTTPKTTAKGSYTETVNNVSFVMKAIPGRSFYMGETEVTQALWQAVMGNNPSKYKGSDLPVESIYLNETKDFIQKLNKLTGKSYRLPKEAEWEYAAKGGQNYEYAGSNNIDEVAWYGYEKADNKTHPVGKKKANGYGIYDMTGNVYELCEDIYRKSHSDDHSIRGGSFHSMAVNCRVVYRFDYIGFNRDRGFGFRLSRTL